MVDPDHHKVVEMNSNLCPLVVFINMNVLDSTKAPRTFSVLIFYPLGGTPCFFTTWMKASTTRKDEIMRANAKRLEQCQLGTSQCIQEGLGQVTQKTLVPG
jgi:hypothetical protein